MSQLVQIVSYEEEFNDETEKFVSSCGALQRGDKYHVLSIIGPQSSGKSTLLNMLFDTKFETMDANAGRYQVTQGVWMGYDDESSTFVMDLEGTDSRERGEEALAYERKSALFALAVSEVLIINIWTQDVGRLSASNLLLLKNILELDVQLFITAKKSNGEELARTKLLFVLRDHVQTPLAKLTEVLTSDVRGLWNNIEKPENLQGSSVEDFFDLDFFALPHKNLSADEFWAAGEKLRDKFRRGEYFASDIYNRHVDADGLTLYAKNVWETIKANRELDIPSQREMVSVVRCDDALEEVTAAANVRLTALEEGPRPFVQLDKRLMEVLRDAKEQFHEKTQRQLEKVVKRKEHELEDHLTKEMTKILATQIELVTSESLEKFRKSLDELHDVKEPWDNFGKSAAAAREIAVQAFDDACKAPEIEEVAMDVENRRGEYLNLLDEELSDAVSEISTRARAYLLNEFVAGVKEDILPALEDSKNSGLWQLLTDESKARLRDQEMLATAVYGPDGLNYRDSELQAKTDDILGESRLRLVAEIKKAIGGADGILRAMKQRFNAIFRLDEFQNPRVWRPSDDVPATFEKAKNGASEVGDRLAVIRLGDIGEEVIIDEVLLRDLRQRLESEASIAFVDARHAQEMAKMKSKVPMWAILLLFVLGFNETKMVLHRPWMIFVLMIVFFAVYFIYVSKIYNVVLEPMRRLGAPLIRLLRQKLVEHGGGEMPEEPSMGSSVTAEVSFPPDNNEVDVNLNPKPEQAKKVD
eukprot:CAMPEP_0198728850 /NCGR_PEP_ID=MMETSP1475-20131203/11869_1 /TAXON_ID= ORGANISM="Unidentified sp., Strain CCMP1999" /NCGR_SAMPLE_ID=MMETSP1475 /ASSEMBLY_ACC=CAM_ASM_001111 /LENGTH=756 /DNA_ID=CAMNT_0044491321 /DNA_START=69 /DNA_END=2339 /DNA_ORIENTATION=-